MAAKRELTLGARSNSDLSAACCGETLPEPELFELTAAHGFLDGRMTERFDRFSATSAEEKLSKDLHVAGVIFFAQK